MIIKSCTLNNFGDTLNIELIKHITGKTPILKNNSYKNRDNELIYMCIGSVLGWADKNTIIWGTGKISAYNNTMFKEKPKKICAVRGKLTRNEILKQGFDCPEVYGDPALLFSKYYKPVVEKEHDLGIICHHVDKKLQPLLIQHFPEALQIDIQDDIYTVINKVNKCKYIASSALHGIIIADAYNIPAIWLKMSDNVLGGGFKFLDYFSSVDRNDVDPLILHDNISIDDILKKLEKWSKPNIDLQPLIDACPFQHA